MRNSRSYSRKELIDNVLYVLKDNFKYGIKVYDFYSIKSLFNSLTKLMEFSPKDLKNTTSTGEQSVYNDIKWAIKTLYEENYLERKKCQTSQTWIYFVRIKASA